MRRKITKRSTCILNKQEVKNVLEMGKNFNKWGGKKSPKLHKYTLKLYNYAILQGLLLGEERNAI